MKFRALVLVVVPLVTSCVVGDSPTPGTQPGTQPGSGSGSGLGSGIGSGSGTGTGTGTGSGTGSGSGTGTGSGDQGVPPMVTEAPSVGQQSVCGGLSPVTLTQAVHTNGCSLAAGATGSCMASSGTTFDGLFAGCVIQPGQADCTLPSPYVECPVGETSGPLSAITKPPAGQAGYGFEVDISRTASGGSVVIQYTAFEIGVRADGSVAWQGPSTSGQTAISTDACCELQYLASFPGSGLGEKVGIDLQWF